MAQPIRDPGDAYVGVLVGLATIGSAYLALRGLWDHFHGSTNPGADLTLCLTTLALVPFGVLLSRRLLTPALPDAHLLPQSALFLLSVGVLGGTAWAAIDGWMLGYQAGVYMIGAGAGLVLWWRRRRAAQVGELNGPSNH